MLRCSALDFEPCSASPCLHTCKVYMVQALCTQALAKGRAAHLMSTGPPLLNCTWEEPSSEAGITDCPQHMWRRRADSRLVIHISRTIGPQMAV